MNTTKTIFIASPRGFCAGVVRAINTVEKALELCKPPLYVHHQIVHNRHVVSALEKKGAIFVESIDEIPENSTVVYSAHGVSPEVRNKAARKNLFVIDATCPLVTKVHQEAIRYAKQGYKIFYIGHKNHPETAGTTGEAPENIEIIESESDAEKLKAAEPGQKTSVLTQTTLSVFDTDAIVEKIKKAHPGLETPNSSDICYATTNRQIAAKAIAEKSELVFVVGSKNSSNSNRLKEVILKQDTPAVLIDSIAEIDPAILGKKQAVGITAGASTPESLVEELITYLKEKFNFENVEYVNTKEENTSFALPEALQKLLTTP